MSEEPHRLRAVDQASPLATSLQMQSWSAGFKMHRLHFYNGEIDLKEFVTVFEARIESTGGDEATMAKGFVLAIRGIILSWYTSVGG